MTRASIAAAVILLIIAMLAASCAEPSSARSARAHATAEPATPASATSLAHSPLRTEPWPVDWSDRPGRILITPHFRLHTTMPDAARAERLALYAESMLAAYRGIAGQPDALPPPPRPLHTFLLATRGQWELQTRLLLGESAGPMLAIQRGGFTIAGRTLLYDLGPRDTTALLAHEAWHQYAQTTFAHAPPAWLDEGIGTLMEGHIWNAAGPTWSPWANPERFDELRRLVQRGELWSLDRLLSSSPGGDVSYAYYAQVWILAQFLLEGSDGRFAGVFRQLIRDCAEGSLPQRVAAAFESPAAPPTSAGRTPRLIPGVAIFEAYFGLTDRIEPEFRRFVLESVGTQHGLGGRERIVQGLSPVRIGRPAGFPKQTSRTGSVQN